MIKKKKKKATWERKGMIVFSHHCPSLKEVNIPPQLQLRFLTPLPSMMDCCVKVQFTPHDLFGLSYTIQDHLPRGGTSHLSH